MFLKNWDMSKIYRSCGATKGLTKLNKDNEVTIRSYSGRYTTNYLSTDTLFSWDNGYYQDSPEYETAGNEYWFIWPGGDIDGTPARIIPSINREVVCYEDFNLYSPFYGGNRPGSGTIYGQPHIQSAPIYNAELDQWERTVTREFKNISGKTIIIRELGVFKGYSDADYIIAREILDTPIEVQDDGYFKMSFTWKVENPHENREIKRIRQYSLPFYYRDTSHTNNPHTFSPSQKKKMLLVRSSSIYTTGALSDLEVYRSENELTLNGWNVTNLTYFLLDSRETSNYSHERTFVSIELLTPDDTEDNLISMPHGNSNKNKYYTFAGYIYLEDSIENIEFKNTITQLDNPIIVSKEKDEKNIIWIAVNNPIFSTATNYQMDYDFCDYYYDTSNQLASFFFDITDAEEHIFNVGRSADYEANGLVKLQVTMANDAQGNPIPLYEDVPVQR